MTTTTQRPLETRTFLPRHRPGRAAAAPAPGLGKPTSEESFTLVGTLGRGAGHGLAGHPTAAAARWLGMARGRLAGPRDPLHDRHRVHDRSPRRRGRPGRRGGHHVRGSRRRSRARQHGRLRGLPRLGAAAARRTSSSHDMAGVGPRDAFDRGGIGHAIVGSAIQLGIAIAITLPLGIGTAVFMTEVGGRLATVVRTIVEAMTALPSIVAGLFIYTVLIVAVGFPRSGFAAAMALSVMMLPIIARAADVVLRVVVPADCARRASRSGPAAGARCGTSSCRPLAPAWPPPSSSASPAASARRRRCCSPAASRPSWSPTPPTAS